MARSPRTIKVPGATVAPVAPEAVALEATLMADPASDPATTLKPVAAPAAEPVRVRAGQSALPHADDIDPKTITRPVLTAQGWVCPE